MRHELILTSDDVAWSSNGDRRALFLHEFCQSVSGQSQTAHRPKGPALSAGAPAYTMNRVEVACGRHSRMGVPLPTRPCDDGTMSSELRSSPTAVNAASVGRFMPGWEIVRLHAPSLRRGARRMDPSTGLVGNSTQRSSSQNRVSAARYSPAENLWQVRSKDGCRRELC